MTAGSDQRYVVISADTHAGADLLDYKPYLARRWHDEFDAWAATFSDEWGVVDDDEEDRRVGVASFGSSVNWDSAQRRRDLDAQGIAGEVVFPNTVPPFFPSGVISAPGPRTADEYERRWAGVRAHNRWLVDFCGEMPERRAGLAQVFLNDVEDAAEEVRFAKDHGLRGVLLPGDHVLQLNNLYYPRLDPLWEVCAELGMPVHRHGIAVAEAASPEAGDAAPAIGQLEASWFGHRPLAHLLLAGVFERYPDLIFVMTEGLAAWVIQTLAELDWFCESARTKGGMAYAFGNAAASKLSRRPSEYFATNCYLGSFFMKADIDGRHAIGVDRMMWGADYPHHEGTWPHTIEALRANFAGVPDAEVQQMLSGTAAEVYGFDLEALQPVADEIGPTRAELTVPLGEDEWPSATMCPTFVKFRDAGGNVR